MKPTMQHRLTLAGSMICAAIAVLVCTACTPKPPLHAPTLTPPLVYQVQPSQADIPAVAPVCPNHSSLVSSPRYASICQGVGIFNQTVGYVYNLSDQVLKVTTVPPCACLTVYQPQTSNNAMPTVDDLVPQVQNQAIKLAASYENVAPDSGAALVPVGGSVFVGPVRPTQVDLSLDRTASGASYLAKLFAGYVIDNLTKAVPALDYYQAIADCVNAMHNSWQQMSDSSTDIPTIMDTALQSYQACRALQQKITADPAEEQHVLAAAVDGSASADMRTDLSKVADTAGETTWKSELTDLLSSGGLDDILKTVH